MSVYAGDVFAYDFATALASARADAPKPAESQTQLEARHVCEAEGMLPVSD